MKIVREKGLIKLRKDDGSRLPLTRRGAEYCCERECDLADLIAMARRDGIVA